MATPRRSRGRPSKRTKHNISGLKNQPRQPSSPEASDNSSDGDYSDSEALDLTELDSFAYLEVDSDHSDDNNEADWDEIEEDRRDAGDTDWVPPDKAYEAKQAAERRKPGEYIKGPDTASKSKRTQQRYAASNKTQNKLDSFLFIPSSSSSGPSASPVQDRDPDPYDLEDEGPPPTETSKSTPFSTAPPSRAASPPQVIPRTHSASVLSDPEDPNEASIPLIQVDNSDDDMEEDDPNDWDAVVDDIVDGEETSSDTAPSATAPPTSAAPSAPAPSINIRSWHALCEKIKGDLPKQKNLPLIKQNQLLIIRNFATLRIKGFKRIAASLEIARQWQVTFE
ncbi:hypothetical protein B0H13DRAFT_1873365 [Mycena leptocephala]|nr:hypothetical protein B0H13DRAFT_1873365 [Mycena leptocephala]